MIKSVFKDYLSKIISEVEGVHSIFLISEEGIIIEEEKPDPSLSGEEMAAYVTEIMKDIRSLLREKMKGELQEAIFITDNLKTCIYIIDQNIIMLNLKQDGEYSKGRHVLRKYAKKIQNEF
jgi:predicted regulator of Ras-like GTPase activity (Roadblock/LC7/MglB family)